VHRTIYIDMAEHVHLPFRFRIEFDHDKSWIECEIVSQIGRRLTAHMLVASFDEIIKVEKVRPTGVGRYELESWCGAKR